MGLERNVVRTGCVCVCVYVPCRLALCARSAGTPDTLTYHLACRTALCDVCVLCEYVVCWLFQHRRRWLTVCRLQYIQSVSALNDCDF